MRRVLFVPCGVGLGHASRTRAIIENLRRRVEYKIATYGKSCNYFTKHGYEVYKLRGFDFHGTNTFEVMTTLLKEADFLFKLAGDHLQLQKLDEEFGFDTVVSDTDPIGVVSANLLNKRNVLVENMRSSLREFKFAPKRFQNSLKFQYSLFQQIEDHVTQFLDEIIITSFDSKGFGLRKEHNVGLIVNKKVDDGSLKEVGKYDFVVFPVSGSRIAYKAVNKLLPVLKSLSEKVFILNYPTSNVRRSGNLYFFPFMSDDCVRAYIKASKAVISFAGFSTLTDIVYFNKPSLILPLDNHVEQVCNASFFRRKKLGEVVFPRDGSYDSNNFLKGLRTVLSDASFYNSNIDSAGFSFNGVEQASRIILGE